MDIAPFEALRSLMVTGAIFTPPMLNGRRMHLGKMYMLLQGVAEQMFARAVGFSFFLGLPSLMHMSVSCGWQLHFASLFRRYFVSTWGSVITADY